MPGTYISQVYNHLPLWKNNILILTVLINAGHMAIYKYIYSSGAFHSSYPVMVVSRSASLSSYDHVSLFARACGDSWGSVAGSLDFPETHNVGKVYLLKRNSLFCNGEYTQWALCLADVCF